MAIPLVDALSESAAVGMRGASSPCTRVRRASECLYEKTELVGTEPGGIAFLRVLFGVGASLYTASSPRFLEWAPCPICDLCSAEHDASRG